MINGTDNLQGSSLYPRIYHKKRGHQLLLTLILFTILFGILLIMRPGSIGFWYLTLFFLYLGVSQLNDIFARIILYEDRIVRKGWFGSKELMRSDIATFSKFPSGITLIPASENMHKVIQIPADINKDDVWRNWMSQIPNFDKTKEEELIADTHNHPDLGKSHAEREQCIKRDVTVSKWLNRAAYIGAASGLIPPIFVHFTAYVFTIMPWIALYNLYKHVPRYAKLATSTNPIAGNASAFILSALFLGVFSFIWKDYQIPGTEMGHLLALGLIIALPMLYLTYLCLRPLHRGLMYGILLLGTLSSETYGVGVILKVNTAFDRSTPALYTVTVTEKPEISGSGPAIRISPWGNETSRRQISVSRDLYNSIWVNGDVCIHLYSGFLGVPWYTISAGKCD